MSGSFEQDQILRLMREFCSICGGTIISTNHVVNWRGYPSPALGSTWINGITSRIALNRDELTGKLSASLQQNIVTVNFLNRFQF